MGEPVNGGRGPGGSGFSLIEALIALVLLGVGVLAMGGLLSGTTRAARDSLDATVADHLVRQKLEELRTRPVRDLRAGSDSVRLGHVVFQRRWAVRSEVPARGLHEVTVTVRWSDYAATLTGALDRPVTETLSDPSPPAGRTQERRAAFYRGS